MRSVDLTPFGFTPTESLVYEVLLRDGPGTGYAVARSAGLARANAYGSLEGLVLKGAARVEDGRPKRYRPEPPAVLLALIMDRHGSAVDALEIALADVVVPESPTLVEIHSPRGALQLIARDVARSRESVLLTVPVDAYPLLIPALRKASASGVTLTLYAIGPVDLDFATVTEVTGDGEWPGQPVLAVVDGHSAVLASRMGDRVIGHWGTTAPHVAATRHSIARLGNR